MMTSEVGQPLSEATVAEVVARHPDRTGDVLTILETLQEMHPLRYLPKLTLNQVAQLTGVSRSQIHSVVTFYAFFNLEPQGRHTVTVCRGTACHTRGSKQLLDAVRNAAGARPPAGGEELAASFTTPDFRLTVRTVACFGQCAQAPVATVDHAIYGHVTEHKLRQLVAAVEAGEQA